MPIGLPPLRPQRLTLAIFIFALISVFAVSVGCGGGGSGAVGGPTPTPTPTPPAPTPTPTPPVTSAGLLMKVGSATVPTGGIFQYQLLLTEPKPIGNSSTRPTLPAGPIGPIRGVAVNDASGQAVGIAVVNGTNVSISIDSPNSSLGTDVDYPLFSMTMPVTSTATGSSFPVALDASSIFINGSTTYTIQENIPGSLTIGGTLSITDVIPGGGVVSNGDTVSVFGIGFDANTKIAINDTVITAQALVSPTQIDVTVSPCVPHSNPCVSAPTLQLDGERVRAINSSTNETVEYFTYDRTGDAPGTSSNPLVALVHPMFSQQHFNVGTFKYVAGGTQFTGIALQNTAKVDDTVKIELLDASGNSLATAPTLLLPARSQIVRDIADLVTSTPAATASLRVTVLTGQPIKMLGMLGDSSAGTVVPVVVTGQ